MHNKKILLLGADSMLGHSLASQLNKRSENNVIRVNQNAADWYSLKEVMALLANASPGCLICLLGKSGGIALNQKIPADLMLDNLLAVLNIMHACHLLAIKKAIFLGSSCMYPNAISQPMPEQSLFSGYLEPTSQSYAVAKLSVFQLCEAFNQQYNMHFICVIPNTTYGPHDNFDPQSAHVVGALISKFYRAQLKQLSEITVWGSGVAKRELTYVDDVASAIIRCLAQEVTAKINPINISSGQTISIKTLVAMIANKVGFQGNILWDKNKPDGALQKCLDSTKLMSLGWSAQTPLESGLELTYQWYLSVYSKSVCNDKISL